MIRTRPRRRISAARPRQGGAPATGSGSCTGAGKAGVDLSQAFLSVNYAARLATILPGVSVRYSPSSCSKPTVLRTFAPVYADICRAFRRNGQGAPTSADNNGHDTSIGFGFAAGSGWGTEQTFSVGLAYQSKMSMGEFDDYADLFAEAGGFDIPSSTEGRPVVHGKRCSCASTSISSKSATAKSIRSATRWRICCGCPTAAARWHGSRKLPRWRQRCGVSAGTT